MGACSSTLQDFTADDALRLAISTTEELINTKRFLENCIREKHLFKSSAIKKISSMLNELIDKEDPIETLQKLRERDIKPKDYET